MKLKPTRPSFFIGWDVGAWNCDKNGKSRDAIVILDSSLEIAGKPWRGNLRECIVASTTSQEWLKALFEICDAFLPEGEKDVTMAIDTPLGLSEEFIALITGQGHHEPDTTSGLNRYLFRHTERYLFERGRRPMSAIKDMIGSQATKGMHVLRKFAPIIESCGVWSDGQGFRAIESYPSACRDSSAIKQLLHGKQSLGHDDKDDARICALIAHLFSEKRKVLIQPDAIVPTREGWIWVPANGRAS